MAYGKTHIAILPLILLLSFSSGCARYATRDTLISGIESRAAVGMSEEAFEQSVQNATLIETEGNRKVYTAVVGQRCFLCGTKEAFLRSYEVYATRFTFENGRLVSKERIVTGE